MLKDDIHNLYFKRERELRRLTGQKQKLAKKAAKNWDVEVPSPSNTVGHLVEILGVTEGGNCDNLSEVERTVRYTDLFCNLMMVYRKEDGWALCSEIAAKHLPAIVDKFINIPSVLTEYPDYFRDELLLVNAYSLALLRLMDSPYTLAYLRSRAPVTANKKALPGVVAERFLTVAPVWDQEFEVARARLSASTQPSDLGDRMDMAWEFMHLLVTLLIESIKDKEQDKLIPSSVRIYLGVWLRKWARRYKDLPLGIAAALLHATLNDALEDQGVHADMLAARKVRPECGLCNKRVGLRACSRCRTTQYCSVEHQRMHWSMEDGHKMECFTTEY